ncbi:AAA family ATPase [Olsenella massiliensis]|uniref:AAA family ATPase n=1 Tax=Olsenella massiliensis TaxID=1622075 RepID=UPI00071E42B6|nr:AAA family ATPase [Olsenella massiliensis]
MTSAQFAWINFYEELADKLLACRSRRDVLINKLTSVYESIGMSLPKLEADELHDIDPFTVFGLFNKGITDANRQKIIAGIAGVFGVGADQPTDFEGIPVLNNLNATFYAFAEDDRRGEHDIDNLWCVFEAEVALTADDNEENRRAFVEAFDAAVTQFTLGWKLTMGLYWARPYNFISLDSRNRWFMADVAKAGTAIADIVPKEKDAPIHDGERYLAICDAIKSRLGSDECPYADFPSLTAAAFVESERVNQERKAAEKAASERAEENALGDGGIETTHYWTYSPGDGAAKWDDFYARGVMALGWSKLGDAERYASKEDIRKSLRTLYSGKTSQKNSALALWQFSRELKPGDIIFAKRGWDEILGRGIVEGDYEFDESDDSYPNIRRVRWTHSGKWRSEYHVATKPLTDITAYPNLVAQLNSLFEDEDSETEEDSGVVEYPAYTPEDFLSEVYMDAKRYRTLVNVLRAKKNIILQGAPGVGKTFAAKRLAYSMMGVKDAERVMMVQFHQSYSYEDFIEGFRPNAQGFDLEKGAFYNFCKRAQDDSDNDYFFIIDEINRGNLSKIFGELFMLIENDKRGPRNTLQLLYSHELFYVPGNVYLIGMMNTADRSLAMLDYALRRRFAFFELRPAFDTESFTAYQEALNSEKFDRLIACVVRLNEAIASDESLGNDFCIGHSYFCRMSPDDVTDERLSATVDYELVPMLREYWFDEPSKVDEWAGKLRRSIQ